MKTTSGGIGDCRHRKRVFPGLTVNLVNEEWKVYLESRKDKARTQIIRAGCG
ncbi:MAG: hypothetical protein R3E89_16380 [Thiolinea sp.]